VESVSIVWRKTAQSLNIAVAFQISAAITARNVMPFSASTTEFVIAMNKTNITASARKDTQDFIVKWIDAEIIAVAMEIVDSSR
jgi:hypothetical protein